MKTNLPADFAKLADAVIENEATDAQLEELESAIMESANGAEVFRDLAERAAIAEAATASASAAALPAVASRSKMTPVVKVIVFASMAAAAALVVFAGAGLLFLNYAKAPAQTVAATPVTQAPVDPLGPLDSLDPPLADELEAAPVTAGAVPEPSTSLLLLSGMSVLLFRRRR